MESLHPSFTTNLSAEEDRYPSMKFYPTKSNREFDIVIKKGIVIRDELNFGAMYLQSHLTKEYPVLNFTWMPRALPNNLFLVDPPNAKWRDTVHSKGHISLGYVSFQVAPFDSLSHDGGYEPVQVWLNIKGFPPRLWSHTEFCRLVEELGGFLVDVDPRSSDHYDFTVLRMKIGVPKMDIIPKFRRLHFVGNNGSHRYHDLFIAIEGGSLRRGTNQPRQYWQQKRPREEESGLDLNFAEEESSIDLNVAKKGNATIKNVSPEQSLKASASTDVRDNNRFSVLAQIWDPWAIL